MERSEFHVERAIPEGSRLPDVLTDVWLPHIAEHPDLAYRRADFRNTVLEVARWMLHRADAPSRTTTPGIDWLVSMVGRAKSTVHKALAYLRKLGYVGIVASGRQAMYVPASADAHARWGKPGEKVADRAVYVLCIPASDEELVEYTQNKNVLSMMVARAKKAVDINRTPIQKRTEGANPKANYEWASPTLKGYFEAAARVTASQEAARTDLSWPRNKTTDANDEAGRRFNELQAARSLQWDVPALQALSSEHVARMCRRWFRSGWTVNDIKNAIDNLPDGKPRSHDGFTGVRNVAAVFQKKMSDWWTAAGAMYSPYQRSVLRSQEARERALRVAQAKQAPVASEAARESHSQGVAMLRAALRNARG